jgi:hypothetical protein
VLAATPARVATPGAVGAARSAPASDRGQKRIAHDPEPLEFAPSITPCALHDGVDAGEP